MSLLPTPRTGGSATETMHHLLPTSTANVFGVYTAAVEQWGRTLGRLAPAPLEKGPRGGTRLSAKFVEWMMGLPDGWVTDPQIGLSRSHQLRVLGNGVVPQQATAALARLLEVMRQRP